MNFEDTGSPEGINKDTDGAIEDPLLADLIEQLGRDETDVVSTDEYQRVELAARSYRWQYAQEFGQQHDHMRLVGQDNFRRYLPVRELRIRIDAADSPVEILLRVVAARSVGCRVTLSYERVIDPASAAAQCLQWLDEATDSWAAAIEFVEESDDELAKAIENGWARRIRYAHADRVPDLIRKAANLHASYVADEPVLTEGRVELLWYLEEQSISDNYHRYGNLGDRIDEERAVVK